MGTACDRGEVECSDCLLPTNRRYRLELKNLLCEMASAAHSDLVLGSYVFDFNFFFLPAQGSEVQCRPTTADPPERNECKI